MIDEKFVLVGVALNSIGGLSYLIDTIKGKVQPNKVTWFLWGLAPLIAFSAQIKQGVGLQSWLTFSNGFIPLLIFIGTFINKKASWKLHPLDFFCGFLAIIGLVLWYLTSIPNVAILFAILADTFASIPTIIKSWSNPESESATPFILAMIAVSVILLTVKNWEFAVFAFPLYVLINCAVLFILIQFKLGKRVNLKVGFK